MNKKFQLAIEDNYRGKEPLNAFLVRNPRSHCLQVDSSDCEIRKSTSIDLSPKKGLSKHPGFLFGKKKAQSVSNLPSTVTHTPVRRYSVCDLNTTDPHIPISPVDCKEKDYFSRHHRRNSVALKFKSPKTYGRSDGLQSD